MKVWITRPQSDELHLGGFRMCKLFLTKPLYDHRLLHDDGFDCMYERGWCDAKGSGLRGIRDWLKQDEELLQMVWNKIVESVELVPPTSLETFEERRLMLLDDMWETKCHINHKRMIIELDIVKRTVEFVIPSVMYHGTEDVVETLEVPENLATIDVFPLDESKVDILPF